MIIYVVEGSTGEYSDYTEWLVKAFKDEDRAIGFAVACNKEANKLEAAHPYDHFKGREGEYHPLDDNYRRDYTGTHYTYFSMELEE